MVGFIWDNWQWAVPLFVVAIAVIALSVFFRNWKWIVPAAGVLGAILAIGRAHKQGADYEREQLARRNAEAKRRADEDTDALGHLTDEEVRKELKTWGKK